MAKAVQEYIRALADERLAEIRRRHQEYGWDAREIKAWCEGDLWVVQTSGYTLVFGERERLVARGYCADADFPQGRKRIAECKGVESHPEWDITRRAQGVFELWVGHRRVCIGGRFREPAAECRAHRQAVGDRYLAAARADESYTRYRAALIPHGAASAR